MAEAIEKVGSTAVGRPDYVKGNRGFEKMETRDMVLPRLSLCQATTPQRQESHAKYIPDLKEGQLFNSLTSQVYGKSVTVVPLFFFKSRILFKDIDTGGGIICQAPDGKSCQLNHGGPCIKQGWGPNGEPPECTEFYNYPSLIMPARELIVISLKVTALKAGREWNALMRMRGADMFAGLYDIRSAAARNKAGQTYYTYVITNGNPNPWADKETYQYAEQVFNQVSEGLATGTITVDESTISDDAFADRDAEM